MPRLNVSLASTCEETIQSLVFESYYHGRTVTWVVTGYKASTPITGPNHVAKGLAHSADQMFPAWFGAACMPTLAAGLMIFSLSVKWAILTQKMHV